MIESVKFFTSKLLELENCKHGFFCRNGGVSTSRQLRSLNFKSWEDIEPLNNIIENKRIVLKSLGATSCKLLTLNQIHSNKVMVIDSPLDIWNEQPTLYHKEPEADAIVCNQPGIAIGVKTADCVPILMATNNGKVIAAIHAGWRGLLNGVIKETIKEIKKLSSKKDLEIIGAIGPCIQQENYEVSHDIYKQFMAINKDYDKHFKDSKSTGCHYLLDLPGIAVDQLISNGLDRKNIDNLGIDTYSNENDFFSYRRSTLNQEKKYGCQISTICKLF